MKTRNGFVSNSSTSSFIVVTTKADHEQALKKLSPEAAEVVSSSVAHKRTGEEDLVFLFRTEHNGGISISDWDNVDQNISQGYIDYCEEKGEDDNYYVFEKFTGFFADWENALKSAVTSRDHY